MRQKRDRLLAAPDQFGSSSRSLLQSEYGIPPVRKTLDRSVGKATGHHGRLIKEKSSTSGFVLPAENRRDPHAPLPPISQEELNKVCIQSFSMSLSLFLPSVCVCVCVCCLSFTFRYFTSPVQYFSIWVSLLRILLIFLCFSIDNPFINLFHLFSFFDPGSSEYDSKRYHSCACWFDTSNGANHISTAFWTLSILSPWRVSDASWYLRRRCCQYFKRQIRSRYHSQKSRGLKYHHPHTYLSPRWFGPSLYTGGRWAT